MGGVQGDENIKVRVQRDDRGERARFEDIEVGRKLGPHEWIVTAEATRNKAMVKYGLVIPIALGVCSLAFPACSSEPTSNPSSVSASPTSMHVPHVQSPAMTSTVNGAVPPGTATKPFKIERLLNKLADDGRVIMVFHAIRLPGTRAPIHAHPFGGTTCVLEGEMTLYMEGSQPRPAPKGSCYYMPAGKAMSGVSSGKTNAVFLDSFTVPKGFPVWDVIEPNVNMTDDQFEGSYP